MVSPVMAAAAGLNIIGGILGNKAAKKAQRRRQAEFNRLTGIQHDTFNERAGLSDILNGLLLTNSQEGFDQVSGAERNLRADLGDESVARFDEQLAASNDQTAANSTALTNLMAGLQAALGQRTAAVDTEQTRQDAYRGQADAALAALLPLLGAGANATRRADAVATREATAAQAAAPTGPLGHTPPADPLVQAEFRRRAEAAKVAADAQTSANARVAAYDDAQRGETRDLRGLVSVINRLNTNADTSRAALGSELAAGETRASNETGRFSDATELARMIAAGKIGLIEHNRGGRMAAMDDAGDANIDSLGRFFQTNSDAIRTGYGGRIQNLENFDDRITSLISSNIANIQPKMGTANAFTTAANLLSSFGGSGSNRLGGTIFTANRMPTPPVYTPPSMTTAPITMPPIVWGT